MLETVATGVAVVGTKVGALNEVLTARPPEKVTVPLESTRKARVPFVANPIVFAAYKYIPLRPAGGVTDGVPVKPKLDELNVDPTVNPPVIVTSPVLLTENLIPLFVAIDTVLAADKYRPLEGTVPDVGTKDAPVIRPVVVIVPPAVRFPDVSETNAAIPLETSAKVPVVGLYSPVLLLFANLRAGEPSDPAARAPLLKSSLNSGNPPTVLPS
jgi:hypothetical protein